MKAPRAAGNLLKAFVTLVENPASGALLADRLLNDAGITGLRHRPTHHPIDARAPVFDHGQPTAPPDLEAADLERLLSTLPKNPGPGWTPESIPQFAIAFRERHVTPVEVAERALAIIRDSERRELPMRLLIAHRRDDLMAQAEASAERFRAGKPLGPLDGVPVVVKDELDQLPYPTTVGTRFLTTPAQRDAEVVQRLRKQGALLVGKGNMHEIGLGVTGLNPHHGATRNPYDPTRATGGSSSGPAAAVSTGLCPLAVGADGGGSVRVPAALCGAWGLKATFGRISEHGAAELCWSVAHVGPIAATLRDLALGYAVMAGPDPKDGNSLEQPAPRFDGIDAGVEGIRLGIYRPWFEDADPAIVKICYQALDRLREAGAEVRDIAIDELETMRVAHLVTIVSEMTAAHMDHYKKHREAYGLDTRLNLALGRRLAAFDYVHAQRHRARLYRHVRRVLDDVDAIVTPATGCTAPVLPEDALRTGESNLEVTGAIIRFAFVGNLTGLPALSAPVGYDPDGLPIGLQLMGRPWEEHLLLRLGAALERVVERREPQVSYRYF